MKILHIHPSLDTGGIESMVNNLANEMSLNNDVSVCSIFQPRHNTVMWHQLADRITRITLGKTRKGFSLKEIWKVYRLIHNGRFDVVHIHGFFVYYIMAVFLLHYRVKFFYTIHSDAYMENGHWDKRLIWLKRYMFRKRWINPITISTSSTRSFAKLYNTDSTLIPNGIHQIRPSGKRVSEINKYRLTPLTKILLHIGRIDTPKNQITLCQCIKELIYEDNDIVLLIAGPIANQSIFDTIKPMLNERIIYLGEITEPCEYLACVDSMVLPSIWEGLPVTLLEAMSVGCVPICSPVGGIVDVIRDGENGFLSHSPDKKDFKDAISRFIHCPDDKLNDIRLHALSDFKSNYSIATITGKYIATYMHTALKS